MPSVLLIRHAQASYGAANYDQLSRLGRRQSRLLRDELRQRGVVPDRVATGTLRRQVVTAGLAASQGWPAAERDERWNEYRTDAILARHGDTEVRLEGQPERVSLPPTSQFQRILDTALLRWIAAAGSDQGPYTWAAFAEGALSAFEELAAGLRSGQTGAVFTSAGTIAAVCSALLGRADDLFVPLNRVQVNASVNRVIVGPTGSYLLNFNDHAHFERTGRAHVTYR